MEPLLRLSTWRLFSWGMSSIGPGAFMPGYLSELNSFSTPVFTKGCRVALTHHTGTGPFRPVALEQPGKR